MGKSQRTFPQSILNAAESPLWASGITLGPHKIYRRGCTWIFFPEEENISFLGSKPLGGGGEAGRETFLKMQICFCCFAVSLLHMAFPAMEASNIV